MDARSLWPTQNDLAAKVRAGAVDLLNQQLENRKGAVEINGDKKSPPTPTAPFHRQAPGELEPGNALAAWGSRTSRSTPTNTAVPEQRQD